jgi:hypothetical protein
MSLATEKIDALESDVDREDARSLLEKFHLMLQNGNDPELREELLADLSSYGVTEDDLVAPEPVQARPLTRKEKAALKRQEKEAADAAADAAAADEDPPPEDGDGDGDDGIDPDLVSEETAAEAGEPAIVEEPDGQQALDTGDPILITTAVSGSRPKRAEVKVKAFKEEVDHDLQPGDSRLYLVHAVVGTIDGLGGDVRTHNAEAVNYVEFDTKGLTPTQAIDSVHDLRTRPMRDRAVIDHALAALERIYDEEAPESNIDLMVMLRDRLYDEYNIVENAEEVQLGTEDHEEPEEDDVVDGDPEVASGDDEGWDD